MKKATILDTRSNIHDFYVYCFLALGTIITFLGLIDVSPIETFGAKWLDDLQKEWQKMEKYRFVLYAF